MSNEEKIINLKKLLGGKCSKLLNNAIMIEKLNKKMKGDCNGKIIRK